MSNTTKWVFGVVALVCVVLIAWWTGMFGGAPGSSLMATPSDDGVPTTSTPVSDKNVSALDAQLTTGNAHISALDQNLTGAKVAAVAVELEGIAKEMAGFSATLNAHISSVSASKRPALQAAFNDMAAKLSNATSLTTTVIDNSRTASASALKQEKIQLQTALTYLQAARADISKIVRG